MLERVKATTVRLASQLRARSTRPSTQRLRMELLEGRDVPSVVTAQLISNGDETGTPGVIRLTRTDTAGPLTVNYTVSGTATPGMDYAPLSGTATFADGAATTDVIVAPIHDDSYDQGETVEVTLQAGPGYTLGDSDRDLVTIADDVDSLETLIHQESFVLSGSGGTANVTLTVTSNAPGAPGLYTWTYTVQNPTSNPNPWTSFSVPVEGMGGDVQNPMASNGWIGMFDANGVSWTGGAPLMPGQIATFSFKTAPREVGLGDVTAGANGGLLADLPTAPAPRLVTPAPQATLGFSDYNPNLGQAGKLALTITTASGTTWSTGVLNIDQASSKEARDLIYDYLVDAGWVVQKTGNKSIEINGLKRADGTVDGIKSITNLTDFNANVTPAPVATEQGQVTATNNALQGNPAASAGAPAPRASLAFLGDAQVGTLAFSIATASGATDTLNNIQLNTNDPAEAREIVFKYLLKAGWVVKRVGDTGIEIDGLKKADGTLDPIKTFSNTRTGWAQTLIPPRAAGVFGLGAGDVTNN